MPEEKKSAETPAPSGTPPKAPAATFDVARYRKSAGSPTPSPTAKPRGPKIKFSDLAGLTGFKATDPFEGDDAEYGHWIALTIVAPDGAKAIAISNVEQGPGRAVSRAREQGLFDNHAVVPIRVHTESGINDADGVFHADWTRVIVRFV